MSDHEGGGGGGEIFEKYYHDLQDEIIYDAKMRLKKLIGDKIPIKEKERIIKQSEAKMWVLMKEYIKKPPKGQERNSWKDYQEGRNMFSVCVQPIMEKAVDEMMSLYADELHRRPVPGREQPKEESSDDDIDFSDGLWANKHPKPALKDA